MAWKKYILGDPRPIRIPEELQLAMKQYSKDHDCTYQQMFSRASIILWRRWVNDVDKDEPVNQFVKDEIGEIIINNPPPKGKKKRQINIGFTGEQTFEWAWKLEHLKISHGMESLVVRILCWYLREQGYLKPQESVTPYDRQISTKATLPGIDIIT